MVKRNETDFIYAFLSPMERKELDAIVKKYKKATGKDKRKFKKELNCLRKIS